MWDYNICRPLIDYYYYYYLTMYGGRMYNYNYHMLYYYGRDLENMTEAYIDQKVEALFSRLNGFRAQEVQPCQSGKKLILIQSSLFEKISVYQKS